MQGGDGEWAMHFIHERIRLPAYPTAESLAERAATHTAAATWRSPTEDGETHAKDALAVCRSIVEDLVMSVCAAQPPDRVAQRMSFQQCSSAPHAGVGDTSDVRAADARVDACSADICTSAARSPVLRSLHSAPACAIASEEKIGENCTAFQLHVLHQRKNNSCGFYALHAALAVARYLTATDDAAAADSLRAATDRAAFWTHMRAMQALLLRHVAGPHYPWSEAAIGTGVMEREYMRVLAEDIAPRLPPNVRVVGVPEAHSAARGHGAHSLMVQLNEVACEFRSGAVDCVVLCLGVINHWVALVLARRGGAVEAAVLDSMNNPLLRGTDDAFWEVCVDYIARKLHRKQPSKGEMYLYYAQMIECRDAMREFIDIFAGPPRDLVQWRYDCGVRAVLDAFDKHAGACGQPLCAYHGDRAAIESPCFGAFEISGFLSNAYHPKLIEDTIIARADGPGAPALAGPLRARCARWCTALHTVVSAPAYADLEAAELPFLARFRDTAAALHRFAAAMV